MLPAWEKKREEERQTVKKTIAKIYYFWKIPTQKKIDRESNELFFIIIEKVNKTEIVFLLFLFLKISAAAMAKMRSFGQEKFKSEFWRSQQHFSPFWLLPSLCFIFFFVVLCVCMFFILLSYENIISIRHYLRLELVHLLWLMPTTMIELGQIISIWMSKRHRNRQLIRRHFHHRRICQRLPLHQHSHLHRRLSHLNYRRKCRSIHRSVHRISCWLLQFLGLSRLGAMLTNYWLVQVVRCHRLYSFQYLPHRVMWGTLSLRLGYHQFSKLHVLELVDTYI